MHIYADVEPTWRRLIRRRCRSGSRPRHVRELLALRRRMNVPALGVVARLHRLSRVSPLATARLAALADAVDRHSNAGPTPDLQASYWPALDDLTKSFGFRDGSLYERGLAMYRATV